VLLIDEVDVFFGKDFYGQCMHMCANLPFHPEIKELYEYVWNQRGEPRMSSHELMEKSFTKKIIKDFPNLEPLLSMYLDEIISAAGEFPINCHPRHEYVVGRNDDGKFDIGYIDSGEGAVCYRTFHGAKTVFACFNERAKGAIEEEILDGKCVISVNCGWILYSELPRFFDVMLAMTGTLEGLSDEENGILEDYMFERRSYIPSTFEKQNLRIEPLYLGRGKRGQEFFDSIKTDMKEKVANGRACLVVFENSTVLEEFSQQLKDQPIRHQKFTFPESLHEKLTDQERDAVILRAVRQHQVTLITSSYGRGTDFVCRDSALPQNGGMHVILTFYPEMKTDEIQVQGRTCRQDDPGSFRYILLAEDLVHKGLVPSKNVNDEVVPDLEDLDDSGKTEHEYFSEKRKVLDSQRYQRMIQQLEGNKPNHEVTLELVKCIEQNQRERVLDILKVMNRCKAICSHESHEEDGQVSFCLGSLGHGAYTRENLPAYLASQEARISKDGHYFECRHGGGSDPTHVIFVVDCSGSMYDCDMTPSNSTFQYNRLGCVFEACHGFVSTRLDHISSQDRMSMVAFGSNAWIMFENLPMDIEQIHTANSQISCGEGTDFSPAISKAFEILRRTDNQESNDENSVQRQPMIIFLSDGEASDCSPKLQKELQSRHASGKTGGVRFHSISFGPEADQQSLQRMSDTAKNFIHNDDFAKASSFLNSINGIELKETFVNLAASIEPEVCGRVAASIKPC